MKSHVGVFIHGYGKPVGTLYCNRNTFTFTYDEQWIEQGFSLSPTMAVENKTHYSQGLHPIFSDVAPDRWGRKLIDKKLHMHGHKGQILDMHYLLELSDDMRMGALRFSLDGGITFIGERDDIPPVSSLPKFIRLTDAMINGERNDYSALMSNVSLGGARAKLMVKDHDGRFKLAKLPQPNDIDDIEGWEFVLLELAKKAGIHVAAATLHGDRKRHALLLERFDRTPEATRIHYMSAMTLLDLHDGESDESSYADLADEMSRICDISCLHQLFRRMVFNIITSNVDDHLRNHGFLYINGTWKLSPAFDMTLSGNYGDPHALHIYDKSSPDVIETTMAAYAHFHLNKKESDAIMLEVAEAVEEWENVAQRNQLRGIDDQRHKFASHEAKLYVGVV
ncbi:MAG: type II toxin-antitoxin system HipA family toxin [Mariprofundaceae bacterium]|nr:type II toxin-antitoxin system HipA family toxin [Mariprofundaceae bacterium]